MKNHLLHVQIKSNTLLSCIITILNVQILKFIMLNITGESNAPPAVREFLKDMIIRRPPIFDLQLNIARYFSHKAYVTRVNNNTKILKFIMLNITGESNAPPAVREF